LSRAEWRWFGRRGIEFWEVLDMKAALDIEERVRNPHFVRICGCQEQYCRYR